MQYCIILTVNLLTWRKESPVFLLKTEPFIPTHDTRYPPKRKHPPSLWHLRTGGEFSGFAWN